MPLEQITGKKAIAGLLHAPEHGQIARISHII